jgi:multidrug resistance efflux pump
MALPERQQNVRSVSERLRTATTELQVLEQIIVSGDFSPRILSEFRNAVDSIRHTARTVQTWIGLQEQNRDPYTAMTTLSADRVRRATQIANDLTIDLQSLEVDFEIEGLEELFHAIEALRSRLAPLFKVSGHHV